MSTTSATSTTGWEIVAWDLMEDNAQLREGFVSWAGWEKVFWAPSMEHSPQGGSLDAPPDAPPLLAF